MKKIITILLLLFSLNSFTQNGSPTCAGAEPACSDNTGSKIFPNVTGQADQGAFGCLDDTPNGAWFFIKVGQTGQLAFNIIQNTQFDTNGNPTGTPIDVDFVAWGPFNTSDSNCNNLATNCGTQACPDNTENPNFYLTNQDGTNIIDCSYSPNTTEGFTIPNAQSGEFYILLVTNWATPGQPGTAGFIKLEQTNFGGVGAGVSDCSIIAGELGADQEVCNGTNVTLDATPTVGNVTEYKWFLDTGAGFNVINGQTNAILTINNNVSGIYKVEITDDNGGTGEDEITISFFDVPIANQPNNIKFCDSDRDGFNTFDFDTVITTEVLNGQSTTDFEVLYFTSMAAANANVAGTNIISPYTNTTSFTTETIYARAHNINKTDCANITSFTISVRDIPIPENPTEFRLCDNTSVGSDTDGFINDFILSNKDSEILGLTNSNSQFNVSYHTTLIGAQTDATTDVIDKTTNYENTGRTQQIFVRVENKDNATCFDATKSLNLVVSPLPVIKNPNPAEIRQCVINPSGLSTINLTVAQNNIADNTNGTFEFYEDPAAMQQILNFTSYPIDANTNPPKSVWVKTISELGCSRISELRLIIGIANNEAYDETFFECDDFLDFDGNDTAANSDVDGVTWFRLDKAAVTANITVNPNIDVFFFETSTDRDEFKNPIDIANYRNKNIPNTTGNRFPIYYKLINRINNDCTGVGQIYLQVNNVPTATAPLNLEECDNFNDGSSSNGLIQSFNLESQNSAILGIQNPAEYTVTYYTSAANANSGTNPLTSPFANTTRDSQTIFVKVTNNTTGCFTDHTSFSVVVNQFPTANFAPDIEVCDDDSDGSARNGFSQNIDLESRTTAILGAQDPTLISVSYHASLADAQGNIANLVSPFSNTVANRQTIYIRVFNQTTQCANGISNFDVVVNTEPLANPDNTLSDLLLCDTDIDGDDTNGLVGDIDLTTQIPTILGTAQDPDDFNVSFYLNQADATAGNNALPELYSNSTRQETIFVRIENKATGCINDDLTFQINVQLLPSFSVMGEDANNPQIFCLNATTRHILEAENPVGNYNYEWTDNTGMILGSTASLIIVKGGEYTVKATDNTSACERKRTIFVKESEKATLQESFITIIDESNNIGSQNNISVAIDAANGNLGKGEYQFAIFNTDNNVRIPSIGFQDEPLFENLEGGLYTVIVNDKNGCVQDETLTISVIEFPKFFSPNGDGKNDTWVIKGANNTFYTNESGMNIFNRFGKLVGKVTLVGQGWNGMYNGKTLPSDDYWFNILLIPVDTNKNPINKKGNFSLLRR